MKQFHFEIVFMEHLHSFKEILFERFLDRFGADRFLQRLILDSLMILCKKSRQTILLFHLLWVENGVSLRPSWLISKDEIQIPTKPF